MKDYSFIATNKPVNRTAGIVLQKGEHYEYENKSCEIESDTPILLKTIPKKTEDLTGRRRGRFTVIGLARHFNKRWIVRCDCGKYSIRKAKSIKNESNNCDRCTECRKLAQMKRHDYWKRTGMDKPIEEF